MSKSELSIDNFVCCLCVYNEQTMIKSLNVQCVTQFCTCFWFKVVLIKSIKRRYDSSPNLEFKNGYPEIFS